MRERTVDTSGIAQQTAHSNEPNERSTGTDKTYSTSTARCDGRRTARNRRRGTRRDGAKGETDSTRVALQAQRGRAERVSTT